MKPKFFLVCLLFAWFTPLICGFALYTSGVFSEAILYAQSSKTLIYDIDYTELPDRSYRDLTLIVQVGPIEQATSPQPIRR